MFVKQLYTGCLSEAAYFIEHNGEAAVIDPLRDIDIYLQLAKERNAQIKYIFETHFHADFVSGHIDLATATNATIIFGPGTEANFPVLVATDGQVFNLGDVSIQVLHTPGHTLESTCYLLKDEKGEAHSVFTGDTLFVNDVGRPDLAQKENALSAEDLAGMLYDSLQTKILPLPNETIVYPAHGAGSACGKNMGPETFSTIGKEKQMNYALQPQSKPDFIKAVLNGLSSPPAYFPINAQINKEGYDSMQSILQKALQPLNVNQVKEKLAAGALLLDTRPTPVFTKGFIPESIFIGLDGRFAEWAGSILPYDKEIMLVTDEGMEKETVIRMARVGFNKVVGFLQGGINAWTESGEELDMIIDIEADELAMDIPFDANLVVLDVRRPAEFAEGHVVDAINLPLNEMNDPASMAMITEEQNLYVHCAGGYRSVIAASLLKRQGLHNLRNILGGWSKIKDEEKIKTEKEKSVLN